MKSLKLQREKRRFGNKQWAVLIGILLLMWMVAGCSAENGNQSNIAGNADNGGSAAAADSSKSSDDATTSSSTNATTNEAAPAADAKGTASALKPSSTGASLSEADVDATQGIDRKIVYKGNVTMEVKAYDTAQTALRDLIHLSGGYLLKFADQKTAAERGGTFTIKLPASGFDGFLSGLEKIEHLSYQSSAQGTDVTEEYVDLQARLKARQVVEARLLDFMEKATKTADLLQISNQLGDVQTEIEQIKGRTRYLDNNVAFSTIELRMYETSQAVKAAGDTKQGFADRISDAVKGSAEVMNAFLQGMIVVIAGAIPVVAVLAVIGIPVYAIYRRSARKRTARKVSVTPTLPAPDDGEATSAGDEQAEGDSTDK